MPALSIEGFQLSPQQKRLSLLTNFINNQQALTQFVALIEGKLNRQILRTAVEDVIGQYEILRTTFQALPEMNLPLQVICDRPLFTFNCHDLSHLNAHQQRGQIKELSQVAKDVIFDGEQESLLVVTLIQVSEHRHLLVIKLSALCADRRSLDNILQEISTAYGARLEEPVSSSETLQYADIAEWQNELFEGEEATLGKAYWQNQDFSGIYGLKLPWNRQKRQIPILEPEIYSFPVKSEIIEKIEALVRRYDSSTDICLLACWQVLLWRLTGQSDLILGVGFAGRNYEELENAIGLFAKYLPIKGNLEANLLFYDLLAQLKEEKVNASQWQDYFRWEDLVNKDQGIAQDSLPYFPFGFDFYAESRPILLGDLSWSIQQQSVCFEPFALKLSVCSQDENWVGELHYDPDVLHKNHIQSLAEQFDTLLTSIVEEPDQAIGNINIVSEREGHHLLVELNHSRKTETTESCDDRIHQRFERQTSKHPDATAVVYENQQITYQELNNRANQLAHYLISLGVTAESIVGLYVERSLELVIGILAILKAGGAYLPLDPALPEDRLVHMVRDAQPLVVLSQHSLIEQQGLGIALHLTDTDTSTSIHSPEVVCFDRDGEMISQASPQNPSPQSHSKNLAYVIYTSGSTGTPKGVLVEHGSLLAYVDHIQEILKLEVGSQLAFVSTFAADLGHTVFFPSLCGGGCLHVVASDRATDPNALATYFEQYSIDYLKIVPSHFQALLAASQPERLIPRKYLILGGEALNWTLIQKISHLAPNCQILNHYGPTETTVGVLTYALKANDPHQDSTSVPIGRPLPPVRLYILDAQQNLLPYGIPGELYIGGSTVARGYLNQEKLSAAKFIANPFEPSGRIYKTGDRVCYLPDGNIEFLGRVDRQVKIRGFRIELEGIETILAKHPALKEVVVVAHEDELKRKSLVAYLVLNPDFKPTTNELRQFLLTTLPDYMVPGIFIPLRAMPLTANGKIDRQNLPAPESTQLDLEQVFIAPRTKKEIILAQIWGQVLLCDRIGIHDNFFDLGGDSILGMQIIARANQSGLQITPKQIFEYQTIAELAAVAAMEKTIVGEQGEITGNVPLTPIQKWFFAQNLIEPHHWNQSVLLEVSSDVNLTLLEQTLAHLLQHHDGLRLQFVEDGGKWEQSYGKSNNQIPFVRIVVANDSELEDLATQIQASLNLSQELIKVALFEFSGNRPNLLLIAIHHLVVDGISWRILLEDFQTVYQQLSQGNDIQLPAKTTSFKQWSEKLQEYAESEELSSQLDYWLKELKQPVTHLPKDYPEGNNNTRLLSQTVSVALTTEETQALLQEVPAAYQTQINDVLLTALGLAWQQQIGESSLNLDLEGHGREDLFADVNLSRTIGWFTSLFPVNLNLHAGIEVGDALKIVKEKLRTIPNSGIGYGLLRYLGNEEVVEKFRDLPKNEIRFNYLGQFDGNLQLSSLFRPTSESAGVSRSLKGNHFYNLDINSSIVEGKLQLNWTYSSAMYHQSKIEKLANCYLEKLQSIIQYCQSPEVGDYTPSDFPNAGLDSEDLDLLMSQLS